MERITVEAVFELLLEEPRDLIELDFETAWRAALDSVRDRYHASYSELAEIEFNGAWRAAAVKMCSEAGFTFA